MAIPICHKSVASARAFHLPLSFPFSDHKGVCEQTTPPKKKALGEISMTNIKSGAGEEFLLLLCEAEARARGICFSQTPVSRTCAMLDDTNRHGLDLDVHAPGKHHTKISRAGKQTLYRKPGFAIPGSILHRTARRGPQRHKDEQDVQPVAHDAHDTLRRGRAEMRRREMGEDR